MFEVLKNRVFARLYIAQTVNLFGDALTWLGLALLAYDLAGVDGASQVLSFGLLMRVSSFVIFAPFAGILADKIDRKLILIISHLCRMLIVGLLPFVQEVWQFYILVLLLNVFYAFFTPTFKATIPLVFDDKKFYSKAISLSSATYQLLGVLGPGIAGAFAVWFGTRQIFFIDGITFLIAAVLIFMIPSTLKVKSENQSNKGWGDLKTGTFPLFKNTQIRFGLLMQLVASIVGAQILVNTITFIKGYLMLGSQEYGLIMSVFGLGATLGALSCAYLSKKYRLTSIILAGGIVLSFSVMPANELGFIYILPLWLLAGAAESLVNIPTETLIAENIPKHEQGRVYGAHFAWSHLWWVIAYPIAGWIGSSFTENNFFIGSIVAIMLLIVFTSLKSKETFM
ncbi:MAG TPA: MFS transporter [Ignavibacteria bacterium]|nr:MFS transporter [Ignavibacteria bacterium]